MSSTQLARGVDWREHLDPAGTLACEFTGKHPAINNTHFGALKLKDAICDQLRDTTKLRPSIETHASGSARACACAARTR